MREKIKLGYGLKEAYTKLVENDLRCDDAEFKMATYDAITT